MFLGGMQGMERVMQSDVRAPYLTMVTGPPGSMKSSFCLTLVSNHLNRTGEFGLYCTVEESLESLRRGAQSMGIQLPSNLQLTDLAELRRENDSMDSLKFTRRMTEHFKQQHGDRFTTFVLDSLGAIYSLTTVDEAMRKKMFSFFDFLRSMDLNVFIITERQVGGHAEIQGNEGFLADGIINLGMDRRNGQLVRTLQVEKMRHIRHAMEKQAIDVGSHGLVIMGPLFD
jgi:KaiC/GvpD/RAD55 family RecA-like ATPase